MAFALTWLGHATFQLRIDGHDVLLDPYLEGNPKTDVSPDEIAADFILVSHGHGDHVGDTVAIARRTGALCISNAEISRWLKTQGVERTHGQHLGGSHAHPFGEVKLTIAHHGSGLPDGSYGGNPAGFLLTLADGHKIYFACDTALFGDMKLYGEEGLDLAVLPIGDNFTMGPEDALRAVHLLRPRFVIPCHYGTFPLIEQDAEAWAEQVGSETNTRAVVLQPGGSFEL